MEASKSAAREYEDETGFAVGDLVCLGHTAFAPPGTRGMIVGVELDLRDNDAGTPTSDPCFRVRLQTGAIVYVTPDQFKRAR